MDMGMKMGELTECMDARHHARTDVAPIEHRAGDLPDRLPGETRKLTQQPTVVSKPRYFSRHGSEESRKRYGEVIAAWSDGDTPTQQTK